MRVEADPAAHRAPTIAFCGSSPCEGLPAPEASPGKEAGGRRNGPGLRSAAKSCEAVSSGVFFPLPLGFLNACLGRERCAEVRERCASPNGTGSHKASLTESPLGISAMKIHGNHEACKRLTAVLWTDCKAVELHRAISCYRQVWATRRSSFVAL